MKNYAIFRLNFGTMFFCKAISNNFLIDFSPFLPMLIVTSFTYIYTNFSIKALGFPLPYFMAYSIASSVRLRPNSIDSCKILSNFLMVSKPKLSFMTLIPNGTGSPLVVLSHHSPTSKI